jgi:hypothetical protein
MRCSWTSGVSQVTLYFVDAKRYRDLRDAVREYLAAHDVRNGIPVLSPAHADAWTKVDDALECLRELVK